MWSYYGAKTNVIDAYPKPVNDMIIEPFAGTARYSLKYFEKDILLVDKYDVIINIWKWLQKCSIKDINSLPHHFKPNQSVDDFNFDCKEAKDLIGFLIGFGMEAPRRTASAKRMTQRPNHINYSLNRIANNLFKIKHWNIQLLGYQDIKNDNATWFIDPPYQFGGHVYKHSNKSIDFKNLGDWCMERQGQIIVCENNKADWLNFIPIANHKTKNGYQHEVIYCNHPTIYDNIQTKLF